jgi:prepilin-type N-terminal cleavage/methylation domain-containing protein
MNKKQRTIRGFTLIELLVAVAILVIVLSFAGVIFRVSIDSHRMAIANAEIMQKLRAITDQLNSDFKGIQKDGFLVLFAQVQANRREYRDSAVQKFRADRLYYFSAGDFQSWVNPVIRSNISRVYFGHEGHSLDTTLNRLVSAWTLARDVVLLTPGYSGVDYRDISYAECKVDLLRFEDPCDVLITPVVVDMSAPDSLRSLMCQNAGEIVIEWSDGTTYPPPDNSLVWFGFSLTRTDGDADKGVLPMPVYASIETKDLTHYIAFWKPDVPQQLWPKALKFTFTLYDSKGVIKNGRTFTHIVYLGD